MKRRGSKNKRKKRRITKQKLHKYIHHVKYYKNYLMEFVSAKVLELKSRKRMK